MCPTRLRQQCSPPRSTMVKASLGLFLRLGVQGDAGWGFYVRKEGRDRTSGASWWNPDLITQSVTSCRVGYGEGMAPTSWSRGQWHRRMGPRDSALMHPSTAPGHQVRGVAVACEGWLMGMAHQSAPSPGWARVRAR